MLEVSIKHDYRKRKQTEKKKEAWKKREELN